MFPDNQRCFRVKAPVTWRPPHRSVREDFPHTVPQNTQALRLCITRQVLPHLAHNIAALLLLQFSEVTLIWIVVPVYHPSFPPEKRYAWFLLPYSGSRGPWFPTFSDNKRPSVLWSTKTAKSPSQICSLLTIQTWYLAFPVYFCVPKNRFAWGAGFSHLIRQEVGVRYSSPWSVQGDKWLSRVPTPTLWMHALVSDPGGDLNTCHSVSNSAAFQFPETVGFHFQLHGSYHKTTGMIYRGSIQSLHSWSIWLRTPVTGFTRRFHYWPAG